MVEIDVCDHRMKALGSEASWFLKVECMQVLTHNNANWLSEQRL